MTHFLDLSKLDYFPVKKLTNLLAVGWLAPGQEFTAGKVSEEFFNCLQQLIEEAWQPFVCAGVHRCELCEFPQSKHSPTGHKNLFVPYEKAILVAPELILHYINAHHYCPPDMFIDAVILCPKMGSMDYKKAVLANGGRGLSG